MVDKNKTFIIILLILIACAFLIYFYHNKSYDDKVLFLDKGNMYFSCFPVFDKGLKDISYCYSKNNNNRERLYFVYYLNHEIIPDCNVIFKDSGITLYIVYLDIKRKKEKYEIENSMLIDMTPWKGLTDIYYYILENGSIKLIEDNSRYYKYEIEIVYKTLDGSRKEDDHKSHIKGSVIVNKNKSDKVNIDNYLSDALIITAENEKFSDYLNYLSWIPEELIGNIKNELIKRNGFFLENVNGEIRKTKK